MRVAEAKVRVKSSKGSSGRKRKWSFQPWAMQQEPAPQKLRLWLRDYTPPKGQGRTAEFPLKDCLSRERVARGDGRVFMQAVIGPKDDAWLVTGTPYKDCQPCDWEKRGRPPVQDADARADVREDRERDQAGESRRNAAPSWGKAQDGVTGKDC
ncbi:hypothetical protein LTR53_003959 [Teratosphaeriaceae sp. CCFEE 6253]|nr:hypothetical protein LTR53_003959 [Teratosphaeriaceae sp. CCFEE 6253]